MTLGDLRVKEAELRAIWNTIETAARGAAYRPFEFSPRRPLRPSQPYFSKLPAAFVNTFPALADAARQAALLVAHTIGDHTVPQQLGADYRAADEEALCSTRDPFAVDPALVERGLRGHARTQNSVAAYLRKVGVRPRSPRWDEPMFDLAWEHAGRCFVAEVKSITGCNEEKQLRLGLGQVLRYADQLGRRSPTVPVLVAERKPTDASWIRLCERLGVLLVWPSNYEAFALCRGNSRAD